MKKLLLIAALFTFGCHRTVHSPERTETGSVYDTAFVPKGHGSGTAVGYNTGKNSGVTISPVSVDIPERFAVVFKCEHGKFVIDGEKGRKLYQKLEKGDRVEIRYREVIRVTSTETNIVDLDFLDANKIPE